MHEFMYIQVITINIDETIVNLCNVSYKKKIKETYGLRLRNTVDHT